tara:strand:+ start:1772 stop:2329 length:558 start_codon:yes stop_codon:yes gene_type:complete
MVKDFKINDLVDQLAQNPLNLPYPEAKRCYNQHPIQYWNGHTYDPVPEPLGREYDFFQGQNERLEFYREFAYANESNSQLWLIAWHTNKTGKLNDDNRNYYEQIDHEGLKAFFGKWVYSGNKYLDSTALYHNYSAVDAKVTASNHYQEASVWVDKSGAFDIVNYEEPNTDASWLKSTTREMNNLE